MYPRCKQIALQQQFEADVKSLPPEEQKAALDKLVDEVEPFMPPRELTLIHRSCDIIVGTGSAGGKKLVIQSTSPYTQTGLFQAAAAVKLMTDGPEKAGFAGQPDHANLWDSLMALPNVYHLGVKPFGEVPSYMGNMTVNVKG